MENKQNKKANCPTFSSKNCTACWACVSACPRKAIGRINLPWHRHAVICRMKSIGCNRCVEVCSNHCFSRTQR
ncbi:MAG: 4Fe-4S binding protein [Muribaculaceae bacterium]|nr:4Fe-4S binding protein [Muribaculaceae bacterium]